MGRRGDEGAAVVEFVFLAILVMVPVVYVVLALARIQEAAFGVEAAARDVSRAAVVAGVSALQDGSGYPHAEQIARDSAQDALDTTLTDFHLNDADITLACSSAPCLAPGSDVEVSVTVSVALPGIGSLLPAASVSVTGSASSPVDGYAG